MSINFVSDFDPQKEIAKLKREIIDILDNEFEQAVNELEKNSPVGVTKQLSESWLLVPTKFQNGEFILQIVNSADNAINRLEGRPPGKQPSSSALERWVELKFNVDAKRAKGFAFVIAKKIAEQGTKKFNEGETEFDLETEKPVEGGAISKAIARSSLRIKQL